MNYRDEHHEHDHHEHDHHEHNHSEHHGPSDTWSSPSDWSNQKDDTSSAWQGSHTGSSSSGTHSGKSHESSSDNNGGETYTNYGTRAGAISYVNGLEVKPKLVAVKVEYNNGSINMMTNRIVGRYLAVLVAGGVMLLL